MENKIGKSNCNTAYGRPISDYKDKDGNPLKPFQYEYKFSIYQTDDELVAAKDEMTLEEQRKSRNADRVNNARAKQLQTELDNLGIVKPTADNDDQVRLKDMFDTLMTSKLYTEEQAREMAAKFLQVEWSK